VERRLVAHVLLMAAGELGHPLALFVQMETDDRTLHPVSVRASLGGHSRTLAQANMTTCQVETGVDPSAPEGWSVSKLITTSRPRGPISSTRGNISVVIPAAAAPPSVEARSPTIRV
jgi:hypothetical protein